MTATRNTSREAARPAPAATADAPRRLTARSVIASTLLGLRPPQLPTAALVAGAELLGVSPGTARVAISRMVASGELEPTGDGYRLAGHLLDRQARQQVSVAGAGRRWNGMWSTAIVPAEARPAADRAELRRAMAALRHAELRDGVWLRPANLATGAFPWAERVVQAQTITVVGTVDQPEELAARLWDLQGWSAQASTVLRELSGLQARLDRGDATALADSFVAAAGALRHLQADPLLPPKLLPASWPGAELRAAQDRFDTTFKAALRAWHLARR